MKNLLQQLNEIINLIELLKCGVKEELISGRIFHVKNYFFILQETFEQEIFSKKTFNVCVYFVNDCPTALCLGLVSLCCLLIRETDL